MTSRYKQEYYLDKEGFSVSHGDEQISIYHPSHLSSIQFDGIDMTAVLNMDYHHDHPMIHFPLRNDTADVFVDVSHSRFAGKERLSSSLSSLFPGSAICHALCRYGKVLRLP